MNVAIVGYGFVGQATEYLLRDCDIDICISDPDKGMVISEDAWDRIEYAFICVPTPECEETGTLMANTAMSIAWDLPDSCVPIVRSTVGPDQVINFPPETIFMPEFLREKHWKDDTDDINIPLYVGAITEPLRLLQHISKDKHFILVEPELACMFKIARNSALAMTVAVANEFAEACAVTGVRYNDLAKLLVNDKDLANTHWDVPGHDGSLGFGGKCLPKDLSHMETLVWDDENILAQALYINEQRR